MTRFIVASLVYKFTMSKIPEVIIFPTPTSPDRKLYFDNNKVEDLMLRYRWTGCTDAALRDNIMKNTEELIRQIIRAHNLHRIYPGQEESAFMDLYQTAWVQIERTLYKYKARVHCANCYNPIRPAESCIHNPEPTEYNIITPEDVLKKRLKCPSCKKIPSRVIYRGCSKIFNMWCVRPDTLLLTTNGINNIKNVSTRNKYDDKQEIWTIGEGGKPSKVVAGLTKTSRRVLDIKTELGFEIGCTPEHSILCDGAWKQANKISIGDLVTIQYNQQFFVDDNNLSDIELTENRAGCSGVKSIDWQLPNVMNSELAYIIGLYIAEGSCSHGQLAIYNINSDVIDALVNNNLGLKFIHYPDRQCIVCNNKRFVEFIKLLQIGDSACEKIIPHRMLIASKDNIISMLSGLFDGNGHSSKHNGCVGYTSTSIMLIRQLRMVLLNLGILTKIQIDNRSISRFIKNNRQYDSNRRRTYQLICSTSASMKFYSSIGFKVSYKQAKSHQLTPSREFIYGLNSSFRRLYKKYGCGKLGYNKIRTAIREDRIKCEANKASELMENWDNHIDDPDIKLIKSRLNQYNSNSVKTIWLPVISIDESESPVCEISVDSDDHSYVANGIISHNSQVARTVILAYIKKESRDHKNSDAYKVHLDNKRAPKTDEAFLRFLSEAKEICKYNKNHMDIIDALEFIMKTDDRPYEGIIGKLVKLSDQSRAQVTNFLKMIRLRGSEFTDSPMNDQHQKLGSVASEDESW